MPKLHKLTDVEVETVGLVTSGANQEEFFLLKSESEVSKEDIMPNETDVQEEEAITLDKEDRDFLTVLKKLFNLAPEKEATEPEPEPETESELDKLQKEHAELEARLAKAEKAAEEEREAREKSEFIEKAEKFDTLPVKAEELAEHLYPIHKADSEEAKWFVDLFRSVDAQLKEAGVFAEKGTSESPEQPDNAVAKAEQMVAEGKAESFKEAYLNVANADADAYINKRRAEIREGN